MSFHLHIPLPLLLYTYLFYNHLHRLLPLSNRTLQTMSFISSEYQSFCLLLVLLPPYFYLVDLILHSLSSLRHSCPPSLRRSLDTSSSIILIYDFYVIYVLLNINITFLHITRILGFKTLFFFMLLSLFPYDFSFISFFLTYEVQIKNCHVPLRT